MRKTATPADARKLARLREAMDAVNLRLLAALEARTRAARAILAWKRARGLPARDRAREEAMLRRLLRAARSGGVLGDAEARRVFRAVFAATLAGARSPARLSRGGRGRATSRAGRARGGSAAARS